MTDKLGVLIYEIGELEDQFVDRYDQYRITMKSIRNIEASVQPSRDRKFRFFFSNHVWNATILTDPSSSRQAEDHRRDCQAQVQGAQLPPDRRPRAGAGSCGGRVPGR